MKKISTVVFALICVHVSGSLLAQCPAGSPCAQRSGGYYGDRYQYESNPSYQPGPRYEQPRYYEDFSSQKRGDASSERQHSYAPRPSNNNSQIADNSSPKQQMWQTPPKNNGNSSEQHDQDMNNGDKLGMGSSNYDHNDNSDKKNSGNMNFENNGTMQPDHMNQRMNQTNGNGKLNNGNTDRTKNNSWR
jgi:hypothetical protein